MPLREVLSTIEQSPFFTGKLTGLNETGKVSFPGLSGAAPAAVLSALAGISKNLLVVTANTKKAEVLAAEIELFSGRAARLFPARDESKESFGRRLSVVNGWRRGEKMLVVAPLKAVGQATSPVVEELRLESGQSIRLDRVIEKLIELGYKRFDIVGEKGEFCLRGGILDIFPINSPAPARLEFLGDRLESLRTFDSYSQRSVDRIGELTILPAVEKAEILPLDLLPAGTILALDEPLELQRAAEDFDFSRLERRSNVELSVFLREGEGPVFSAPPSYVGGFEKIPVGALIVSRHAVRLREEGFEAEIIPGELRGGFVFDGFQIISDRELFGEESVPRRREAAPREGVADELLADLKAGDYVVHENYGIGLFRGMKILEIEDVKQEYLLIEYAEADKLYVPPHMAGLVEKYEGGRESRPRLSRLGTREWLRARARVKQAVREMTEELVELYASRQKAEKPSLPPDDIWQKELEATFPFDETPDQIKAINEVKREMESSRPMDRLVCGDVGYGKTEVAIRAAAKAASAGKQAAILAPTTILVEQHYNNFKKRFANLPFVVEMLSRFRSAAEQEATVRALAEGGVDIVIGTHRLLSKDIKFKNLGLLVIDEEQKFGVAHKEKLKKLKASVDVLTLTATPIPRTLYFSLSGIREMSLIATPPVDRSPVRTYVLPYSEKVIREAILREIDRGGQIYYVYNYVETIAGATSQIKKLVPEAKVAVAHGQMDEKLLEKTMLEFMDRKFDVLVCTSIIESGLDIPNVNTILIDHADRFGLSQLYQIRGRVGRSAARAHAYLFYHPARSMTDAAVERLKAIQEFTALGSGYKLAMKDLEIRGAGNLLGAQQSGHIFEVGFDLYCELLEEAVREIKGEKVAAPREVEINLNVEASIPPAYVPDDRQRIALYRRMNLITTDAGVKEMRRELEDRFGKLPPPLERLLQVIYLRIAALERGVKSISEADGKLRIEWESKKVKFVALGAGDKVKLARRGIGG